MGRKWIGSGSEVDQELPGSGPEMERKWIGSLLKVGQKLTELGWFSFGKYLIFARNFNPKSKYLVFRIL